MIQVSILSPVFNEEQHIHEMIASVVSQTHTNWQLIFVDDGSTDRTGSIIQEAAAQDDRIVIASLGQKLGKSAAFNLAHTFATGKVVCLLAGDDRLPPDSLEVRVNDLRPHLESDALAAYKLRSFSLDPNFDNMTLPRGEAVSFSGGTLTMTNRLADEIFPIPPTLPSEDVWLGRAAPDLATHIVRNPHVILEYRIHPGNSNPRQRPFHHMSTSMALRHEAWRLLLDSDLALSDAETATLQALYRAEQYRRKGKTLKILRTPGLSLGERSSLAAMSEPKLFKIRNRFYRFFSGRQRR